MHLDLYSDMNAHSTAHVRYIGKCRLHARIGRAKLSIRTNLSFTNFANVHNICNIWQKVALNPMYKSGKSAESYSTCISFEWMDGQGRDAPLPPVPVQHAQQSTQRASNVRWVSAREHPFGAPSSAAGFELSREGNPLMCHEYNLAHLRRLSLFRAPGHHQAS